MFIVVPRVCRGARLNVWKVLDSSGGEAPTTGAALRAMEGGSTVEDGVSKANFQSHSRALISHCEVASVASGLHVVMDTKAWDPRDGEWGDELLPCL